MEHAYRNAGYWLLALTAVRLAGFWVPYCSVFPHFDAHFTGAVHLHALAQFSCLPRGADPLRRPTG